MKLNILEIVIIILFQLFNRLSKERAENLNKIKFTKGDLLKRNLGLKSEDFNILLKEVQDRNNLFRGLPWHNFVHPFEK